MRRFDADPDIVGRSVQLGSTTYAIVGVMPEGFGFPLNHSFWIPWRLDAAAYAPRTGPAVNVFGRLAPGATLESAQAELTAIGQRVAASAPATHEHLRAARHALHLRVQRHGRSRATRWRSRDPDRARRCCSSIVCVNVAILVYARTATRQGEIAVRGALGASRRRIVAQLFVEALMLAGVAAAGRHRPRVGGAAADSTARLLIIGGALPFWMTLRLSADGVLYVVALTLLAAAIVGVVPALKATGTQVQHRPAGALGRAAARACRWDALWTMLIVAQVAFTVAVLPAAMFHAWKALRFRTGDAGFASQRVPDGAARARSHRPARQPMTASARSRRDSRVAHRELERRA